MRDRPRLGGLQVSAAEVVRLGLEAAGLLAIAVLGIKLRGKAPPDGKRLR